MATSFQSRLQSVERRRAPIEAARPQVSPLPDWRDNIRNKVEVVSALGIGALAAATLILASSRFVTNAFAPQTGMLAVAGFVGLLGFFVARKMGVRAKLAPVMPLLGALVIAATFHNAAHRSPGFMAVIAGPGWVSDVISTTEAQTIALAGMSVSYASPPEEEVAAAEDTKPKKPTVGFGNKKKAGADAEGEANALPKVRRMN